MKVDFQGLVAQSEAVRRQQEERAARRRAMVQQRIQEVKQEMRGRAVGKLPGKGVGRVRPSVPHTHVLIIHKTTHKHMPHNTPHMPHTHTHTSLHTPAPTHPYICTHTHTTCSEFKYDMEDCLTQMEACFNLLLPRFDIPDSSTQLQADSEEEPLSTSVATSKGKEEKRRTISSGSFASLSSIDDECCSDEEGLSDVNVVVTNEEQDGEVAMGPASFSGLSNFFQKGRVICSAKGKERAKG